MEYTATAEVHAALSAGVWTDLSPDVAGTLRLAYGRGPGPLSSVDETGAATFLLRNDATPEADEGRYSPGHPAALAGWSLGTPVRIRLQPTLPLVSADDTPVLSADGSTITVGPTTKFLGAVSRIRPEAGRARGQRVEVEVQNIFGAWAEAELRTIAAQVGQTEVSLLQTLFAALPTDLQPEVVRYDVPVDSYPYALDDLGSGASPLAILQDVMDSGLGTIGVRGNGDVVYQSRETLTAAAALGTFTGEDDIDILEAPTTRDGVYNEIVIEVPQITLADSPGVLASAAEDTTGYAVGETVALWLPYRDPNDTATTPTLVGGTDVISPEPTTDYAFNSAADGSGTSLTTTVTVTATAYAGGVDLAITNLSGSIAYCTFLQVRGTAIRRGAPLVVRRTSAQRYGRRRLTHQLRYQTRPVVAERLADALIGQYADPAGRPDLVQFAPLASARLLRQALRREPGDRITLSESMTGVAGDVVIRSVEISVEGPQLWCRWGLTPYRSLVIPSASDPIGTPVPFTATGGTVTTSGEYTVHVFETVGAAGTFSVRSGSLAVEYWLVAGGGGSNSGSLSSGGGGAGGVVSGTVTLGVGNYAVVVGAGGASGTGDNADDAQNGGDSYISGTGIEVARGGGAAGQRSAGRNGGSGGGAGGDGVYSGGTAVSGQGYAGGTSTSTASGGGGGAGGAGGNASGETGGAGGIGVTSSISGAATGYAAGGGGHGDTSGDGSQGTGGGQGNGANGGVREAGTAGIVILRYLTPIPAGSLMFTGWGSVPALFVTEAGATIDGPTVNPSPSVNDWDCAVQAPSGVWAFNARGEAQAQTETFSWYSAAFAQIAAWGYLDSPASYAVRCLSVVPSGTVYGISDGPAGVAHLRRWSSQASAVPGLSVSLAFTERSWESCAVDAAEAILYHGGDTGQGATGAVHRRSLPGGGSLSDLVACPAGATGPCVNNGLLVLSDGTILVAWNRGGYSGYLRRYDTAGTLLTTYTLSDDDGFYQLARSATDGQFWVSYYAASDAGITKVAKFTADGTVVQTFDLTNDGYWDSGFAEVSRP